MMMMMIDDDDDDEITNDKEFIRTRRCNVYGLTARDAYASKK